MKLKHPAWTMSLVLVLCALHGCSKRRGAEGSASAGSGSQPLKESDAAGFQYPPARWRLATFEELDRTTLWIGHIAIRHEQSQLEQFRPGSWTPDPPNPERSVAEAQALAEKVAAQAIAAPGDFERLARAHSEDVVSKDDGGMLGGVRASQLVDSDFLDALAVLKPGEVSKPLQTPYGFHILKRYAPPPEEQLAGARIVIGYEGVFGLERESRRTRAEAQQLARQVLDQARKPDQDFRKLVDRYSENIDRIYQGDLGVYSTRDPEYLPVEVHRLAQLKVGEVTGPIDSRVGFEILKRVPIAKRQEYAMTTIELPFDVRPTEREASEAAALKKAEAVRRTLDEEPARFQEFQGIHCCDRIHRWTRERGEIELTRALDALSFGEIAQKPLQRGPAFILLKRLDPSTLPPEKPRHTELPNPSEPDYDALLKYNGGQHIAEAARRFVDAVRASSEFTPSATERISQTLGQLAGYLEQNADDHSATRATVASTLKALESQLGAEQFGRFKTFGQKWVIRQMMPQGPEH